MIYYAKDGDYEPPLGDSLGDLTNELEGEDEYIIEGVFNGPKNYSYKTNTGRTKCVVKGFSISNVTSLKINFESLKKICLENRDDKISVEQTKFTRNKDTWDIQTSVVDKMYKFVYDKRVLTDDYKTIPYGY